MAIIQVQRKGKIAYVSGFDGGSISYESKIEYAHNFESLAQCKNIRDDAMQWCSRVTILR